MKYALCALLAAASLSACSSDNSNPSAATPEKDVLMRNDFESLAGWIPDASALTQTQAHSGRWSLKVDQAHEFSPGYNYLLGQLSATRIRGVRLDAWAYTTDNDPSAQIVVALNSSADNKPIMTSNLEFSAQVKESGKWVKVSKEVIFPPTINYTTQIVIYLWRGGRPSSAYIDDIQLTALR